MLEVGWAGLMETWQNLTEWVGWFSWTWRHAWIKFVVWIFQLRFLSVPPSVRIHLLQQKVKNRLKFTFHMYDKKSYKRDVTCSITPPPDTNCHTFSNPLPLERDVLYGRPLDGFALLCMITPRSIPSSEALNVTPPMSYLNFLLPFPMCLITELWSTWRASSSPWPTHTILLRFSLIMLASSSVTTSLHSLVSSEIFEIFTKLIHCL